MKDFIENILKNLNNNGFPAKRVSLPTDKLYEAAENKSLSFNTVLKELKEKYLIESQIGADKIVFWQSIPENKEDLMSKAQEMMSKMSPEELQKIQEMFEGMSPEEKNEMMKKGRELGIV